MSRIIDFDTVHEFAEHNKKFITDNIMANFLLMKSIDDIFDGKLKPLDGFNVTSKGGEIIVLVTNGICMLYGNYASDEIALKITDRIRNSIPLKNTIFAGTKKLVDSILKHNKLTFQQLKHRIHYECKKVNPIQCSPGQMLPLNLENLDLYVEFGMKFHNSYDDGTTATTELMSESLKNSIENGSIFQWVNQSDISSICRAHVMYDYPVIDFFFTDEKHRGKGYGASLVHSITSKRLKEGHNKCILTADGDNQTSNSVFQKVGYKKTTEYLKVLTLE